MSISSLSPVSCQPCLSLFLSSSNITFTFFTIIIHPFYTFPKGYMTGREFQYNYTSQNLIGSVTFWGLNTRTPLLSRNTRSVVQAGGRRGAGHWVPLILWTLQPGVQSHSGQLLDEHSQDPRDPVHSQSQHHKYAGRELHG